MSRYVPNGSALSRTEGDCPFIGYEHGSHWFPVEPSGKEYCIGWHEMTRKPVETRARFPLPYVRGAQSNLVHRSAHTGLVVWFPINFHQYGPSEPVFWEVLVVCANLRLKNPSLLSYEDVLEAIPYTAPATASKYPEVTLCAGCFGRAEPISGSERRKEMVTVSPCPCECNSGGFCGGCGHAGCGGR